MDLSPDSGFLAKCFLVRDEHCYRTFSEVVTRNPETFRYMHFLYACPLVLIPYFLHELERKKLVNFVSILLAVLLIIGGVKENLKMIELERWSENSILTRNVCFDQVYFRIIPSSIPQCNFLENSFYCYEALGKFGKMLSGI